VAVAEERAAILQVLDLAAAVLVWLVPGVRLLQAQWVRLEQMAELLAVVVTG
jgi:hypothetical protein